MATKTKLIVALVVVIGIIGGLIRTAITHASTYYVTVAELAGEGQRAINQPTTVSGTIVGKSVEWNPSSATLHFSVVDKSNPSQALPVVFHGPKPDDFSDNWPVIVSGSLTKDGVFTATKLLVKCPSKYQAANQTETRTYTAS